MKKIILLALLINVLSSSTIKHQTGIVIFQPNKDLNIDFMLRGYIYGKSSIEDTMAAGGFGESDNTAKKIMDSMNLESGLFMKIDTTRIIAFKEGIHGYTLFMVNNSDTVVHLVASDSRLNVLAEVYYEGKWVAIEYFPGSKCGNSYHKVYLKQNEYWSFEIPKFSGKIKTKLRYRLVLDRGKLIYSNAIETYINVGQLSKKQEYKPNGIMDLHND